MQTMLDTTNWVAYPFDVNGVKFNSLIDPKGEFYIKVEKLPTNVFINWNKEMVLELIGDPSQLTTEQIENKLEVANLNASGALLSLA